MTDSDLTVSERDILRMMANGLTDEEVAARLGRTRRTVSNHVSTILL